MQSLTDYYVRTRQRGGNYGLSDWSPPNTFKTISALITGTETQKIMAGDGSSTDYFGYSIALSGDGSTAAVSAYMDDIGANETGAVYIYVKSGTLWVQQAKFKHSDSAKTDYFGYSIALNYAGNVLVSGAHMDDDVGSASGSVYIFKRTGVVWIQSAKIKATDGSASSNFGISVDIDAAGTTILVGAWKARVLTVVRGAAYVFGESGTTWAQKSKLVASDGLANNYFGSCVSLSQDGATAAIGAYGNDSGGTDAGAAYVFFKLSDTFWAQNNKVQAPTPKALDAFGRSIAISGNGRVLIVGGYNTVAGSDTYGSVYVFVREVDAWTAKYKLLPSDRAASDYFGSSVATNFDGSAVLIGAYADDDKGSASGSAYLYKGVAGVWSFVKKIVASDGQASDYFGYSVALNSDGSSALIGAYLEDAKASNAGAVYAYS